MRLRSVVAVAVGGVADIVATNLLMLPVVVYIAAARGGLTAGGSGTTPLVEAIEASTALRLLSLALGIGASIIGGYVAARIARRGHVRHGAFSSWLCEAMGFAALFGGDTTPWWQHVLYAAGSPAAGAVGGYLRRLQAERARHVDEASPREPALSPVAS